MGSEIKIGSTVRTLDGDIDRKLHKGAVGVVHGFARFSTYHPREVNVHFPDGSFAYFWASSVALDDTPPHHSHKFRSDEFVQSFG